jgi:hypothetical protein
MTVSNFAVEVTNAEPLEDFGFDALEAGLLPVFRHFMKSFENPEAQAWQSAYLVASEKWGETLGLGLAQSLLKVIKYLRLHRRNGVCFHDPLCLEARKMVTPDEAALISMLHHMRRDQTSDARIAVEELTLGTLDPDIIRSGLSFAHRFPAGDRPDQPSSRPALRIVH